MTMTMTETELEQAGDWRTLVALAAGVVAGGVMAVVASVVAPLILIRLFDVPATVRLASELLALWAGLDGGTAVARRVRHPHRLVRPADPTPSGPAALAEFLADIDDEAA